MGVTFTTFARQTNFKYYAILSPQLHRHKLLFPVTTKYLCAFRQAGKSFWRHGKARKICLNALFDISQNMCPFALGREKEKSPFLSFVCFQHVRSPVCLIALYNRHLRLICTNNRSEHLRALCALNKVYFSRPLRYSETFDISRHK